MDDALPKICISDLHRGDMVAFSFNGKKHLTGRIAVIDVHGGGVCYCVCPSVDIEGDGILYKHVPITDIKII